jgi:hypothetical protein
MKWLYLLYAKLPSDYRITAKYYKEGSTHRTRLTKVGFTTGEDSHLIQRLLKKKGGPILVDDYLAKHYKKGRLYQINLTLKKLHSEFELYIVCFIPLPNEKIYEKTLENYFRTFWGTEMPHDWPSHFNEKLYKQEYDPLAPSEWILVDFYFIELIYKKVYNCATLMTNGFDYMTRFIGIDIKFIFNDFRDGTKIAWVQNSLF